MSEFGKGAGNQVYSPPLEDERSLLCRPDPAAGIYSEPILAHINPSLFKTNFNIILLIPRSPE
jgi:hypothetical protein